MLTYATQMTNVIAHPCFFETVRFPTQDKSETLSLFYVTYRDFCKDSKIYHNSYRFLWILFSLLWVYSIIRKSGLTKRKTKDFFTINKRSYLNKILYYFKDNQYHTIFIIQFSNLFY